MYTNVPCVTHVIKLMGSCKSSIALLPSLLYFFVWNAVEVSYAKVNNVVADDDDDDDVCGLGAGFGLMYLPSIVMVGYYFDKKRALATGVSVCGAGIGTFVFAPLGTFLVENYGWKGANIIIGGIILNGIVFGLTYRPLQV